MSAILEGLLIVLVLVVVVCGAPVLYWLITAPEGYEDSAGYHNGRMP